MSTTIQFKIIQPPQFTFGTGGQITSVLMVGQHIFQQLSTINMDNSSPTRGTLVKVASSGLIHASGTEFTQVCNALQGMLAGETRTLEITGNDGPATFAVTAVAVDVPGAKLVSHITGLRAPESDTGTGTAG